MKTRLLGIALVAAAVSFTASSGFAESPRTSDPAHMCIRSTDIRSTRILDDRTIRFELHNGQKWDNKLTDKCVGLYINDGFAYDGSPNGDVCANLQSIRVLHTGNVCLLGDFHKS